MIAFSKIPNPTRFQKTIGVNDFYFGDPVGGYPTRSVRCRCWASPTLC